MCSGCLCRWGAIVACAALVLSVTTASGQDLAYDQAVPTQMVPNQIAPVYQDGTHGPWMNYVVGGTASTQDLGPIFDNYEADPNTWNLDDNLPYEVYDRPKGSGNFCEGLGSGGRFFWCSPTLGCPNHAPSCKNASGGAMVVGHPTLVQSVNILWGTDGGEDRLEVELLFFSTYAGTACSDPGSDQIAGIVLGFDAPLAGFYYTTSNLTANGLEFAPPDGDRIGFQVNFYTSQQNNEPSIAAYPGLWHTKNPDWTDVMGLEDGRGYSDVHGVNDCVLDNQDRCIFANGTCAVVPFTIPLVGPAMLLLGPAEQGETGCVYAISKNAKAKKGCTACPKKKDLYNSGDACGDVKDCAKKLKLKKLDCPDGGPGFCKSIKGKRDSCATP